MKWVTRQDAKVDRVACPWLIRRFVDPQAELLFVPAEDVAEVAAREPAIPFDVPGVELGHVNGRCAFESIMVRYGLTGNPVLVELAKVVHAADIGADIDDSPYGRGLHAIAHGFSLLQGSRTCASWYWRARYMMPCTPISNGSSTRLVVRLETLFRRSRGTCLKALPKTE